VAITADGVAAAAAAAAAASTSPCYRLPLPAAGTAHAANATIVVGGNRTYILTFTRRSAAEESTLYYHAIGRPVQVDPIKPTLKAPGTQRLKL
jgi:hypothetical protein